MAKYVCVRKCYHAKRSFDVGQVYESNEGECVPKHFVEVGSVVAKELAEKAQAEKAALELADIKTFSEMTRKPAELSEDIFS